MAGEPPAADGRASKTDQWRRAAGSQAPRIGPIGSRPGGQWDVAGFTKLLALMEGRQENGKKRTYCAEAAVAHFVFELSVSRMHAKPT